MAEWKTWLHERIKPLLRRSQEYTKNVATHTKAYIRTRKKQSVIIAGTVLAVTFTGIYYYQSNVIPVYHVLVDGKEIGVVSSPDVIHNWAESKLEAEKAKSGLMLKMTDYITYKEERLFKGKYDDAAAIDALSHATAIKVEAVKIVVNGELVGFAPDKKTAEVVLNKLKEKYAGVPVESGQKKAVAAASVSTAKETPVKQVRFKEEVDLVEDTAPAGLVLSEDKLQQLLAKGTTKQEVHSIQEGDTITGLAVKYGITSKDIYASNPGITENTVLQLGQEINVTAMRPLVNVQVTEEVSQQETIPYMVQTRNNGKMPKGETKLVQTGKEGKKQVRYQITKENGQVVERTILEQKVLEQPVAKITERGTKVIPSRGTGRFSWPARGYISSGFGARWGRLHAGIDIAGSGTVQAADNGRVVMAGWYGDYGKAIIIDHGNGMQTVYGHLRSIGVHEGEIVPKGKTIGIKGSTGDSTGVHLHFEVRRNGSPQNPMRYLR